MLYTDNTQGSVSKSIGWGIISIWTVLSYEGLWHPTAISTCCKAPSGGL